MRHTTRGGWKPIKHERILKPDFQKDDDDESGSGRQHKLSIDMVNRKPQAGKEKDINC